MGKVTTGFSMSVDGFIAGLNDSPENALGDGGDRLFKWYFAGDPTVEVPMGEGTMKMSREGGEMVKEAASTAGVLVTARRTFDIAGAWGGRHPMDVPMVVLTHQVPREWAYEGSPFTFITDGIEHAIEKAREIAGEKDVVIGAPSAVKQALNAGLLDEIHIDLVPLLLGNGVRLFDSLQIEPTDLQLDDINMSARVVHMTFSIIK
jgi:dihydrofolate reductase